MMVSYLWLFLHGKCPLEDISKFVEAGCYLIYLLYIYFHPRYIVIYYKS